MSKPGESRCAFPIGIAERQSTDVYALDQMGDLRSVRWEVRGGRDFNEEDFAFPEVTVYFPDGHRDSATYRVDGRS